MDIKQIFANRLAILRQEKGMTQEEFAKDFSEFIGRDTTYSLLAVSSWEIGSKLPTLHVAINIARYFNVSADWLFGLTEEKDTGRQDKKDRKTPSASAMEANLIIKDNQLKGFDKQPVYVVFGNQELHNRWGILDWHKNRLVFSDAIMQLKPNLDCTLYANIPDAERSPQYNVRKPLSMSQILKKEKNERVWVEMRSMDGIIKAKYNGWYAVNPETRCLESFMGVFLPLDRLSISFDVYSSEN